MGCNEDKAKGWALRCHLEYLEHGKAAFTTLTYRPESEPITLSKRHLQLFLKRLRNAFARQSPARYLRFFACGEYGERFTKRAHYHVIIYGASTDDDETIQGAWPHGHTKTLNANAGAMAYVAGYVNKKLGDNKKAQLERVDPATGEVYQWQPPFLQMSRGGRKGVGIAGKARKEYRDSWRSFAILNAKKQKAPRYLHEEWKQTATAMELEKLENEKAQMREQIALTKEQRQAAELIAIAKQRLKAAGRKL